MMFLVTEAIIRRHNSAMDKATTLMFSTQTHYYCSQIHDLQVSVRPSLHGVCVHGVESPYCLRQGLTGIYPAR